MMSARGGEWPLKFTVESVCLLEERTGEGLSALLKTNVSCVRALVWCGLLYALPGLTLAQAGEALGDMLKGGRALSDIGEEIASALSDAGFAALRARGEPDANRCDNPCAPLKSARRRRARASARSERIRPARSSFFLRLFPGSGKA